MRSIRVLLDLALPLCPGMLQASFHKLPWENALAKLSNVWLSRSKFEITEPAKVNMQQQPVSMTTTNHHGNSLHALTLTLTSIAQSQCGQVDVYSRPSGRRWSDTLGRRSVWRCWWRHARPGCLRWPSNQQILLSIYTWPRILSKQVYQFSHEMVFDNCEMIAFSWNLNFKKITDSIFQCYTI